MSKSVIYLCDHQAIALWPTHAQVHWGKLILKYMASGSPFFAAELKAYIVIVEGFERHLADHPDEPIPFKHASDKHLMFAYFSPRLNRIYTESYLITEKDRDCLTKHVTRNGFDSGFVPLTRKEVIEDRNHLDSLYSGDMKKNELSQKDKHIKKEREKIEAEHQLVLNSGKAAPEAEPTVAVRHRRHGRRFKHSKDSSLLFEI